MKMNKKMLTVVAIVGLGTGALWARVQPFSQKSNQDLWL